MKLNELHVRDRHPRAPRHRHSVTGRDVGVRCIEINFSATAGRQHDSIRTDRLHVAAVFIENVNAQATVFGREANLGCGD